jgi:hypothetical protein
MSTRVNERLSACLPLALEPGHQVLVQDANDGPAVFRPRASGQTIEELLLGCGLRADSKEARQSSALSSLWPGMERTRWCHRDSHLQKGLIS